MEVTYGRADRTASSFGSIVACGRCVLARLFRGVEARSSHACYILEGQFRRDYLERGYLLEIEWA